MNEKKEPRQNRWERENRDRIVVIAPKGRKKEILEYLHTFDKKISVNEYINKLIEFDLLRDKEETSE